MKLKNTFGKYAWKVLLLIALLYANKGYAQSEQPLDTNLNNIDTSDLLLINDYSVDEISYLPVLDIDINQKLGLDSLRLGRSYEVTEEYTNTNPKSVIIKYLEPSCTCMIVDWYKQPIPPGGKGWIKIKYAATIPDKKLTNIKAVIYDTKGIKPMEVLPIRTIATVKYQFIN